MNMARYEATVLNNSQCKEVIYMGSLLVFSRGGFDDIGISMKNRKLTNTTFLPCYWAHRID